MLHEQGVHTEARDLMRRHVTLFYEGMALIEQAGALARRASTPGLS
jgi:hypothetical protein